MIGFACVTFFLKTAIKKKFPTIYIALHVNYCLKTFSWLLSFDSPSNLTCQALFYLNFTELMGLSKSGNRMTNKRRYAIEEKKVLLYPKKLLKCWFTLNILEGTDK